MNLEKALLELMKNPKSMIGGDGKAHPALRYTTNTYRAVKWLVDRYNDGTLQVIGYNAQEETTRKKLERHSYRRTDGHDLTGYMNKSKFSRETGFSIKKVNSVARECGCELKIGQNCYINVNKFFGYLDHLRAIADDEGTVNLGEAARILGITPRETKQLLAEGKIHLKRGRQSKDRTYFISKKSVKRYLRRMKGETTDGENDTDDSEVH